jgi:hypothetical protein
MRMRIEAVDMPKPAVRDEMMVPTTSAAEPTMLPSVEAPMSPPVSRARIGIGCASYQEQQDE